MKGLKLCLILPLFFGMVSCGAVKVTRSADDSLTVHKAATGLLKTLPIVTEIRGAKPGEITPASQLEISSRSTIKPFSGKQKFAGFVDWSDPDWVELRLIASSEPSSLFRGLGGEIDRNYWYQLRTNGRHRVGRAVE